MSKELMRFRRHFEMHTPILVMEAIEESHCPHWKRLRLPALNCDELRIVSDYIRETFSKPNTYSHKLPTLHSFNGGLCLTVDVRLINEFVII
jgi:hypothetical protein